MSTQETQPLFDFTDFETRFTHAMNYNPKNTVAVLVETILQYPDRAENLFARAQDLIRHGTPLKDEYLHVAGLQSAACERDQQAKVFPSQVIAELAKRITVIGTKLGLDGEEIHARSEETSRSTLTAAAVKSQ